MSKNIIAKKISLAQLYNFIVSHQNLTRIQNKIPTPYSSSINEANYSRTRRHRSLFQRQIFYPVSINTSSRTSKGSFEAILTNVCRLLTKVERSLIDEIFTNLYLSFILFRSFHIDSYRLKLESFESLLVCIQDVIERLNLESHIS